MRKILGYIVAVTLLSAFTVGSAKAQESNCLETLQRYKHCVETMRAELRNPYEMKVFENAGCITSKGNLDGTGDTCHRRLCWRADVYHRIIGATVTPGRSGAAGSSHYYTEPLYEPYPVSATRVCVAVYARGYGLLDGRRGWQYVDVSVRVQRQLTPEDEGRIEAACIQEIHEQSVSRD